MIKNQKQATITQNKINELEKSLIDFESQQSALHPVKFKAGKSAFNGLIKELQVQLEHYNALVNGKITEIKDKDINFLPTLLISARIAQGISQKGLADKLGIKEQQIQRYEVNAYEQASWVRIKQVVRALNLTIPLENVRIAKLQAKVVEMRFPEGIAASEVRFAKQATKSRGSLIL